MEIRSSGRQSQKESTQKPEGINYLLVIGIDDYQNVSKLKNCVQDGQALIKTLTEKYRFDPENVITLFNEQATRGNILNTLESYIGKIKGGDCLFIWFSGHGETIRENGYWVPVEATNESHQFVSSYDLKERLDNTDGDYNDLGASGDYWTSTEEDNVDACNYYFYNGRLRNDSYGKMNGRSVRCVKDDNSA